MPTVFGDVRFQGQSGKHLPAKSSAFKKEKTHLSGLPHPAPKGSLPSVIESKSPQK
jgi:hypothetical protein